MQSANLLLFLGNFAGHAVLGKYLKEDGLPAMRKLAQTMMIPADEVVKDNEEVARDKALAAKETPPTDPEIVKMQGQMQDNDREREFKLDMAMVNRETEMLKLAQTSNVSIEKLNKELLNAREERASKDRRMAAEAAVTERVGSGGGGHF